VDPTLNRGYLSKVDVPLCHGRFPLEDIDLVIESDEETAESLQADIATVTSDEIITQRRENLGGLASDIVTILQAATPIIAAVMPFVIEKAKQKKVRRLKLGDLDIEGPTDDQVRAVLEKLTVKQRPA